MLFAQLVQLNGLQARFTTEHSDSQLCTTDYLQDLIFRETPLFGSKRCLMLFFFSGSFHCISLLSNHAFLFPALGLTAQLVLFLSAQQANSTLASVCDRARQFEQNAR